jgi:hypothetical protein
VSKPYEVYQETGKFSGNFFKEENDLDENKNIRSGSVKRNCELAG